MDGRAIIAITGIDSGIGKSLCKELVSKGFLIAASYLETNPFEGERNVAAIKMDIRHEREIKAFAEHIRLMCETEGFLYGIVNNAGIAKGGPVENIPLEYYREVFEVNYFGLISFTQKMIPLLIKSRGKIFIMGSMAGRIAMPFLSPYVSTKFALEGFADSLRREVSQFGIKTVIFEPGGIATPIWTKAKKQDISFSSPKYLNSLKLFEKNFIDSSVNGFPSDMAAAQMVRVILKKNPGRRYIIDRNRFMDYITTMLSGEIIDRVVRRLFGL